MKHLEDQTDWERVKNIDENAPIPYDDDDRAERLDDPNDDAAVNAFFEAALELRRRGPQKAPTKKLISIRLAPEVLEHYRATGKGWQMRMEEVLRKAMAG